MMDHSQSSRRESVTEPVVQSRLLPRISFKTMLIAMTIQAVLIAVIYTADQGGTYATAASVGLLFAVSLLAVWMIIFQLVWAVAFMPRLVGALMIACGVVLAFSRLIGLPAPEALNYFRTTIGLLNFQIIGWFLVFFPIGRETHFGDESPFADEQLPPQIMAPREPSN
ncbi:MAG: hypothetical protein KDB00_00050 [Planctomycetales bacterium]|nr:hypothetical protein [Planctomycetales bacterium]